MIRVCSYCPQGHNIIGEKAPFNDPRRTDGACRFHELEALERGKVITIDEKKELNAIRYKRLRMGV